VLAMIRSRVLPRSFHVAVPSLLSKEDEASVCVICKLPIAPGKGRFRTEEGDAHEECYRRTQRSARNSTSAARHTRCVLLRA
jgi:hypothetical protein